MKDKLPTTTITGETSDGYHTFNELYEFRKLYNAALFNKLASEGEWNVHKSYRHSDGELAFGGGWFVVVAELPSGQITNHYENKDWDLFQCKEVERAVAWDGHTAQDVLKRLEAYTKMFKFSASVGYSHEANGAAKNTPNTPLEKEKT